MTAPTICAVLIGRNESRDLPRCLKSLEGVATCTIFVDTGSTDNSMEIAELSGARAVRYLGASEPNPAKPGEWRIVNFAKARNHALELGELSGCSHILWLDCDDEITTPLAIRRAAYMPDACYGVWIELGGGVRQVHYRLWPAAYKIRFYGWVHEWPKLDGKPQIVLNDACIVHDATAHESSGETSNERNLRILTAQYAAEPDARTAFYVANTHKDGGRFKEAIEWYRARLGYGQAFRDEYLFALLYLIRCLRRTGKQLDVDRAAKFASNATDTEAPDWQEFRMELAFIAYDHKEWATCIAEATKALDKPIPQTVLWREKTMYTDQPARLISWCHEHLGNKAQALVWSQLATRLIGQHDEDWARREARLSAMLDTPEAPAIVKGLRRMVALHRPGAIGDILMTLNLLPAFKEANPDTDVHYFCSAGLASMDALGGIILAAGANAVMDCAGLPQWRKRYDKVIDLVGYPLAEGYPEKPMRNHLLHYFAHEMGVLSEFVFTNNQIFAAGPLPSLTLRRPKRPDVPTMPKHYATWQSHAGWSKYKQWPDSKWLEVRQALEPQIQMIQIDAGQGWPLTQSIAMFANATMHIGIDSFCNHLTNYYWTDEHGGRRVPGVVLWGSTQASAAGYPGNVNISKGLPCQPCFRENPAISRMPRDPCVHVVNKLIDDGQEYRVDLAPAKSYDDPRPHYCMDAITVDEVVEAVRETWRKATQ
jgi:ADP-heptose:LPS heptosyltransferase/glycosyltransferase involved in cell wall biosynthesis